MDNRDIEISQLEQKLANATRSNEDSRDDQITELELELEDTRREASEFRQTSLQLDSKLKQTKIDLDDSRKDKKHLKEQLESQQEVIESQRKKLTAIERRELHNRRRQRDETGEQYRLEVENQK